MVDNSKTTKKRFGLFPFSRKNKQKSGRNVQLEQNLETAVSSRSVLNQGNPDARKSIKRGSEINFKAPTDRTTSSFKASSKSPVVPPAASNTKTSSTHRNTDLRKKGWFSFWGFTGSSYFQKMCDDAFDSIDVDRSGKINQSEMYQGLLLIHLKLGIYFGPAACKPISLDRTKFIFKKFDINKDGSLDKDEFLNVMTLLMSNVVSRIVFQFVCTILIIPFVAQTILEKTLYGYDQFNSIVMETWLPIFREEHLPLIEIALGWDLITAYASTAFANVTEIVRENGISDWVFERLEGPTQFAAQAYDDFVLEPIREIPQETWDSLPLTFVSTILTLIIVPYSIVKVDNFFRYIATRSGGK